MKPAAAGSNHRPSAERVNGETVAWVAALGICAMAVAIRVALAPQFDGMDDAGYLDAARRVSDGRSLDGVFPLFRTRVGMAYPLGWLMHAGWLRADQFWILTTAADVVTMWSLFLIGRLTAGWRVGVAAIALYAVYPLAVQQAVMFYPTAFQVMFIAIALLFICLAQLTTEALREWRSAAGLAAGVSLGLGYLVKEDVAIVVPALVLASIVSGAPRRSIVVWVCAGAALVFGLESVGYWLSTGHPLFRLSATSGLAAQEQGQLQIAEIWRWDAFLRSLFILPIQVGVMWWLSIPALWAAWRRGDARLRFLAVAFVVLFGYLQFGSGSLASYVPLPKTPRYTALVTPFLILLVGAWLAAACEAGRRVRVAAASMVVIAAAPCIAYLSIASSERTRNTLAVLPALRQAAPDRLFTDYYGARLLRLLDPQLPQVDVWYHARFNTREMVVTRAPGVEPGTYVLLDRQSAKVYTSSYEMVLPAEVTSPRPAWTLVWTHRAYADGTWARTLLEGVRVAADRLPIGRAVGSRISRNIAGMIDEDEARLYRVEPQRATGYAYSRDASSASAVAPALLTHTPTR